MLLAHAVAAVFKNVIVDGLRRRLWEQPKRWVWHKPWPTDFNIKRARTWMSLKNTVRQMQSKAAIISGSPMDLGVATWT